MGSTHSLCRAGGFYGKALEDQQAYFEKIAAYINDAEQELSSDASLGDASALRAAVDAKVKPLCRPAVPGMAGDAWDDVTCARVYTALKGNSDAIERTKAAGGSASAGGAAVCQSSVLADCARVYRASSEDDNTTVACDTVSCAASSTSSEHEFDAIRTRYLPLHPDLWEYHPCAHLVNKNSTGDCASAAANDSDY